MISAKEAEEMLDKELNNKVESELMSVEKSVLNAIKEGYRTIYYYNALSYESIDRLKSLGYKVTYRSDIIDVDSYKIEF